MVTEKPNLLRVWWYNLNAYQKRELSIHLGTMLFPQAEGNEIDTRVVMVTHVIFEGVSKKGRVKKYFNLAPIILADIYRSLGQCKNGFKIHSTRKAWAKVFHDIKDGNVQWMFQDFMSEKIAIQGAKCHFLILPGIRRVRPYNPNRDDLRDTLDPTPRTGQQIEDVQEQEYLHREQEFQHREYESQRALAFATQELADARACLIRLDLNLDDQLNTLQGMSMSSKAVFAEPHVITSKFLIREEVEKVRGGAGPSAF
ncbi:hypothetical protein KY290_032123 [Solanum tuberosum]|uniref:Integrase core domain containing protein n=1 Tax=Solanum tuberosum TaxID=4113 RepID=A0ABQ7UB82_SOLTU|nr:hypothetical protein KY290_032123 [Solanum tuberosum]